jgi:hypothetical protein
MADVHIHDLKLTIRDAQGHEHRIRPIAQRAAEVLAAKLEQQAASGAGRESVEVEGVSAPAVSLDLNQSTDEHAANEIAAAWLDALAIHLEV